jgi:hypothetical protein
VVAMAGHRSSAPPSMDNLVEPIKGVLSRGS